MHFLITCVVIFSSRQYRHPQETPNCRGVCRMHHINPSINLRTDWTCAPEDACNVHITRTNQSRGFDMHACINQSINHSAWHDDAVFVKRGHRWEGVISEYSVLRGHKHDGLESRLHSSFCFIILFQGSRFLLGVFRGSFLSHDSSLGFRFRV